MGKKRLIVEVNEDHYRQILDKARAADMTVANYVRRALNLPLERQGVKGTLLLPPDPTRGKKAKQKTRASDR